jgi:hypothetical protein
MYAYIGVAIVLLLGLITALLFRSFLPFLKHLRPISLFLIPACLAGLIFGTFLIVIYVDPGLLFRVPLGLVAFLLQSMFYLLFLATAYGIYFLIVYQKELPARLKQYLTSLLRYLRKMRRLRALKRALARKKAEAEAAAREAQAEANARLPILATSALALAPRDKMLLKLRRSQRHNRWGAPLFVLDARLDVPSEARHYIHTYGLGSRLVYESAERQRHAAAAAAHLIDSHNDTGMLAPAGEQAKGAARTFCSMECTSNAPPWKNSWRQKVKLGRPQKGSKPI